MVQDIGTWDLFTEVKKTPAETVYYAEYPILSKFFNNKMKAYHSGISTMKCQILFNTMTFNGKGKKPKIPYFLKKYRRVHGIRTVSDFMIFVVPSSYVVE
jgi:hypothetical protein